MKNIDALDLARVPQPPQCGGIKARLTTDNYDVSATYICAARQKGLIGRRGCPLEQIGEMPILREPLPDHLLTEDGTKALGSQLRRKLDRMAEDCTALKIQSN